MPTIKFSHRNGAFEAIYPEPFEKLHPKRLPPPPIKTGPYAGMPSARDLADYKQPEYDPATQRLGNPTPDPSEGFPVIDYTAEEIAAKAAAEADAAERADDEAQRYDRFALLKKGAAGTLTRDQDAKNQLIFRILKDLFLSVHGRPKPPPPPEPTP